MKISEVIAEGQVMLWDGTSKKGETKNYCTYSCCAVGENIGDPVLLCKALKFLQHLGCPTTSYLAFSQDFPDAKSCQGARFLWLEFARRVALDMEKEGLL